VFFKESRESFQMATMKEIENCHPEFLFSLLFLAMCSFHSTKVLSEVQLHAAECNKSAAAVI
jgi:hypothetical protein